tara:strand:- start:8 stop:814 length:807 start_codon:yes stop_codon:yes gene_type:complete
MPTADSFTVLGRGNGFSFCPVSVDVSSKDFWITMSGNKKGDAEDPTADEINESKEKAMKVWWNAYQFKATTSNVVNGSSTDQSNPVFSLSSTAAGVSVEPKDRVCSTLDSNVFSALKNASSGRLHIQASLGLTALYNGPTSDIDNLVGYSVFSGGLGEEAGQDSPGFLVANARAFEVAANITLSAYGDTPTLDSNNQQSIAYTDKSDCYFICTTLAEGANRQVSNGTFSSSLDPTSCTVSCAFTHSEDASQNFSAASSFSGFDFYTYN